VCLTTPGSDNSSLIEAIFAAAAIGDHLELDAGRYLDRG
jgi:hypothetical protein